MAKKDKVGKKISKLKKEGMPQKQAVAAAINMTKAGKKKPSKKTKKGKY